MRGHAPQCVTGLANLLDSCRVDGLVLADIDVCNVHLQVRLALSLRCDLHEHQAPGVPFSGFASSDQFVVSVCTGHPEQQPGIWFKRPLSTALAYA